MAESGSVEGEVAVAMDHLQVSQEAQIREWHQRIDGALTWARNDFSDLAAVTHDRGRYQECFADAVDQITMRREWLATNSAEAVRQRLQESYDKAIESLNNAPSMSVDITPEERRISEAIEREMDPAYQGWRAEQRWNEEQGEPFDYSYAAFLEAGNPANWQDVEPMVEDLNGYVLPGTAMADEDLGHGTHELLGDEDWVKGQDMRPSLAYTTEEMSAARMALAQDRTTRNQGGIPWVDTIDQLTEADHRGFLLNERLKQGRDEAPSATERLRQLADAHREQTQDKDHGHGY